MQCQQNMQVFGLRTWLLIKYRPDRTELVVDAATGDPTPRFAPAQLTAFLVTRDDAWWRDRALPALREFHRELVERAAAAAAVPRPPSPPAPAVVAAFVAGAGAGGTARKRPRPRSQSPPWMDAADAPACEFLTLGAPAHPLPPPPPPREGATGR